MPQPPVPNGKPSAPPRGAAEPIDVKAQLMASVREHNKGFFGLVLAQAQRIEMEGDSIVFTFSPIHRPLRAQFEGKSAWLEQLAQSVSGRKIAVVAREGAPVAQAAPDPSVAAAAARQAELRARAKAQPEVQTVLDVFGGEIEDVEELDK